MKQLKKSLYVKTLEKLLEQHRKQLEDLATSAGLINEAEVLADEIGAAMATTDLARGFSALVHTHHSPARAVIYVWRNHEEFLAAATRIDLEVESFDRGPTVRAAGNEVVRTDILRFRGFDTPVELEYRVAEVSDSDQWVFDVQRIADAGDLDRVAA